MNAPSFSITKILELRDRLNTRVFYPRFGLTVDGPVIDELVNALLAELPDGIVVDTLYETVRQLVPLVLTDKLCKPWSWRIAGNVTLLKSRQVVSPWVRQPVDEWVPMQILHVTPTRARSGKVGYNVIFRVLAGRPCSLAIEKFWSRGVMQALTKRVGFTWNDGPRPFLDPTEFSQLRIIGLIEAARSTEKPFFHRVDCPSNFLEYNKKILDHRHKVKYPCPRGFRHACHQCAVGYDQCVAGTHYHTYVLKECPACANPQAPFEPNKDHCVLCTRKEALRNVQVRRKK